MGVENVFRTAGDYVKNNEDLKAITKYVPELELVRYTLEKVGDQLKEWGVESVEERNARELREITRKNQEKFYGTVSQRRYGKELSPEAFAQRRDADRSRKAVALERMKREASSYDTASRGVRNRRF